MDANRSFGIELEFISSQYGSTVIASKLTELTGIRVMGESYNHSTKSYWKIVTDGSLSGRGQGLELVSPPLKGEDGLLQIKKLMKALDEIGGMSVNRTCGFHVHQDVNDLSHEAIKKVVARYIKLESSIDELQPESRRGNNNSYCKSLKKWTANAFMKELNSCKSVASMDYLFGSRYYKVNLKSYVKYGTLEFRQHAGTLDYEKIKNWVLLTQHMVTVADKAVKFNCNDKKGIAYIKQTLFIETANEEMMNVLKFYKARAKALAA